MYKFKGKKLGCLLFTVISESWQTFLSTCVHCAKTNSFWREDNNNSKLEETKKIKRTLIKKKQPFEAPTLQFFCSPVVKSLEPSQIEACSTAKPIYVPATVETKGDTEEFFASTLSRSYKSLIQHSFLRLPTSSSIW